MLSEPEKVILAADWHGNGMWGVKAIHHARRNDVHTIIQLGDFGWWTNPDRDKYLRVLHRALEECDNVLYFLDGNHEDHGDIIKRLWGGKDPIALDPRYPRIVHLPRGYRWQWWGKTWMTVGGAVSVDRLSRIQGRSWWAQETLTDEDVEYASRSGKVDIMLAHDCPYGVDIPGIGPSSKGGDWPMVTLLEAEEHRRKIQEIVEAVEPEYYAHGHYHLKYQSRYQFRRDIPDMRVYGLDCDESSLERNTFILERGIL